MNLQSNNRLAKFFFRFNADGGAGGGAPAGGAPAGGAPAGGAPAGGAPAGGAPAGGAPAGGGHWSADWLKPDGTINPEGYAKLPEQLRGLGEGELKNAKTLDDVMTKIQHLATLAGKKGLAPLPADAKPEEVAARNQLLRSINGVPEKPEEYGITKPADLPDAAWNEPALKAALEIMHKGNVPPAVAKALVQSQIEAAKGQLAAQGEYEKNYFLGQEKAFKEDLIKQGVAYDKAMDLATRTAKTFGLDPESPMFKNAQVRLMLHKVGVAIGEPNLVTGGAAAAEVGDRAKAEAIIHDKANPEYKIYWDAGHPQNKAVKQKVASWLAAAVGAQR